MAIVKKVAIVAVVVVLAGATGYWIIWGRSDDDPNGIRVSGNIEVTDAEVSFKLAGRVDERRVDEGELVKQDQVVGMLDSAELESELAAPASTPTARTRSAPWAWKARTSGHSLAPC